MQVDEPPVHKGVHSVHTPFGRTNTRSAHPAWSQRAAIQGRSSKRIRLRHVVTTTQGHECVRAINWPQEQPDRTAHT